MNKITHKNLHFKLCYVYIYIFKKKKKKKKTGVEQKWSGCTLSELDVNACNAMLTAQ